MNILNEIKDNTIIITNEKNKEYILKNVKKLTTTKFFTLEQFLKKYYFDYDEKTLFYLINKYKISYDLALIYLKNMQFLEDKHYNIEKVDKLINLKKELINNNLLIFDPLFKNYLNEKKIIIYDYIIDKNLEKIIKDNNIKIIKEKTKTKEKEIYIFNSDYDEINYVCCQIVNLLQKKVNINNIKIVASENYYTNLENIFSFYNIPLNKISKTTLYALDEVKTFLNNLKNTKDLEKSLIELKENATSKIYNEIINLVNKVVDLDIENIIIYLDYHIKKIKIPIDKLKNAVSIIDLYEEKIENDDHIFILGFNSNNYPKIIKDEDYLSDKIKEKLMQTTSVEYNNLLKDYLINKLNNINNIYLSFSQNIENETCLKSYLIDELNICEKYNYEEKLIYSNLANKIKLAKQLDIYNKFNKESKNMDILLNSYKDIQYQKYSNKYKKINCKTMRKNLENKLTLSYTSIEDYYKCSFRYYLKHILKIKEESNSLTLLIGNLFHYILSIAFFPNFNFEKSFKEFISKYELTNKEKLFIEKSKKDLLFVINTIEKQLENTSLKNGLYEEEIKIKYSNNDNLSVTFKGKIDKIMYLEEDNNTLVAIIDYKTGNPNVSLDNVVYGLNMQLPIYIYLIKNTSKIKNVKVLGFYYQKILSNEKIEKKEDALKLIGYTVSDMKNISKLDKTYEDSKMIKSLKVTTNGFSHNSKVLNDDQIEKLVDITKDNIKNAISNIKDANFDINPKVIDGENYSCQYCEYKDICYKTYEDEISLKQIKDLSYLDI